MRDLPNRRFKRRAEQAHRRALVAAGFGVEPLEGAVGAQQRAAAADDDALFNRGAGRGERVFQLRLFLLELHLGGRADLDHRDPAGQLGHPLLELLAVEVRGRDVDLRLDFLDPVLDRLIRAAALDDRGVVLVGDDAAGAAQVGDLGLFERAAQLFGDQRAAGQHRDVLQLLLAAVAEARRFDREHVDRAAQLVHDQRGERFAVDIVGDDHEVLGDLEQLLHQRNDVLDGADLAVGDQDVGVVDGRFHALRVGDEVGRDVAAVELHAVGELRLHTDALALFDGDHAVFADLLHHIGDDLADFFVVAGDRGDGGDFVLLLDRAGHAAQLVDDDAQAAVQAALERHRVGAGRDIAQALGDDRLGQHGGRGGAVARHIVGADRDFLGQLRAHVAERLIELDLAGDGHAVVDDQRRAELLVQHHIPPARAEGDLDRVGEGVDALAERLAGLHVEGELLGCHRVSSRPAAPLLAARSGLASDFRRLCGLRGLIVRPGAVLDDHLGEHLALLEHDQVLVVDLDLLARVLLVEDAVADRDVHGDALPGVVALARADRNDLALLRLLLRRVRDHDPARQHLLLVQRLDHQAVVQRLQLGSLSHSARFPLIRVRVGAARRSPWRWHSQRVSANGSIVATPRRWRKTSPPLR